MFHVQFWLQCWSETFRTPSYNENIGPQQVIDIQDNIGPMRHFHVQFWERIRFYMVPWLSESSRTLSSTSTIPAFRTSVKGSQQHETIWKQFHIQKCTCIMDKKLIFLELSITCWGPWCWGCRGSWGCPGKLRSTWDHIWIVSCSKLLMQNG